jgi:hypothetical protein
VKTPRRHSGYVGAVVLSQRHTVKESVLVYEVAGGIWTYRNTDESSLSKGSTASRRFRLVPSLKVTSVGMGVLFMLRGWKKEK